MLSEKPKTGLSETRKVTKSTMEKKRRARINNSLTELKTILSGMITHKGERFDKMEKADILELTVKCVRQLQKQTNAGDPVRPPSNPVDEDYKSGMHMCMSEVIKFISSSNFADADPDVKTKLLDHLANKLSSGAAQKSNNDHLEMPQLYQKCAFNENNGVGNIDDGTVSAFGKSNDSNNNIQSINNKNGPYAINVQQFSPSEISPTNSKVFAQYKPVQLMMDAAQQPTSVPTVPFTILVPANLCSTTLGTTCVIPLNLPTTNPQLSQNTILPAVTQQPEAKFTLNPGPSVSLTSDQNSLPNTQLPPKPSAIRSLIPEGIAYTFTPTVVSDDNRSRSHMFKYCESSNRPATVTIPPMCSEQTGVTAPSPANMNTATDSGSQSTFQMTTTNHQHVPSNYETETSKLHEFPVNVRHVSYGIENSTQTSSQNCCHNATGMNLIYNVHQKHTEMNEDLRISEQEQLTDLHRILCSESGQYLTGGVNRRTKTEQLEHKQSLMGSVNRRPETEQLEHGQWLPGSVNRLTKAEELEHGECLASSANRRTEAEKLEHGEWLTGSVNRRTEAEKLEHGQWLTGSVNRRTEAEKLEHGQWLTGSVNRRTETEQLEHKQCLMGSVNRIPETEQFEHGQWLTGSVNRRTKAEQLEHGQYLTSNVNRRPETEQLEHGECLTSSANRRTEAEQLASRNTFVYKSNSNNICDTTSDMWRPW